jgi:cysteine-rich repeat protein
MCGDGTAAGDEQCDDGNLINLDGCDSSCHYETLMRLDTFSISRDPAPSFCLHKSNAFGTALAAEVTDLLAKSLNDATEGGSNNMLLSLEGLDDLAGTSDSSFSLAMSSGLLDPRYESKWAPGAIDAWFIANPDDIDATAKLTQLLGPGAIASNVLTGGPGALRIRAVLGTTTNDLFSRDTTIRALVDKTPAPDQPAPPPNTLGSGQKVFQSLTATASDQGLCSNITVESLSKTNIPGDFAIGANACQASCSDSHSYVFCGPGQPVGPNCNSFLDALVGGCKITVLCLPAILPAQPDVGSNGNPPAPITLDSNNKAQFTVPTDGYSLQLRFKAKRAHLTNNLP